MNLSFTEKKNIRKNFGKLKESLSIPNLIEVQKNSYKQLTENKTGIDENLIKGFDRVFKSIFPIEDPEYLILTIKDRITTPIYD